MRRRVCIYLLACVFSLTLMGGTVYADNFQSNKGFPTDKEGNTVEEVLDPSNNWTNEETSSGINTGGTIPGIVVVEGFLEDSGRDFEKSQGSSLTVTEEKTETDKVTANMSQTVPGGTSEQIMESKTPNESQPDPYHESMVESGSSDSENESNPDPYEDPTDPNESNPDPYNESNGIGTPTQPSLKETEPTTAPDPDPEDDPEDDPKDDSDDSDEKGKIIISESEVTQLDGTKVIIQIIKHPDGTYEVFLTDVTHKTLKTVKDYEKLGWEAVNERLAYGVWRFKNITNPDWKKHNGDEYRPVKNTVEESTTEANTSIKFTLGHGPYDDGTWSIKMNPVYQVTMHKVVKVRTATIVIDEDGNEKLEVSYEDEDRYRDVYDTAYDATYYEVTVPLVCSTCPEITICLSDDADYCDCGDLNTKCDNDLEPEYVIDHRSELTN